MFQAESVTSLILRFFRWDKQMWKSFVVYGISYAVLTLVTPLFVQLIVSNLALSVAPLSLVSLMTVFTGCLFFMQLCRYAQIHLIEYLERQLVNRLVPRLRGRELSDKIMYFEVFNLPKVISKWSLDGFEIILTLSVSMLVLMFYHPVFIVLNIMVWASLWIVTRIGHDGVKTALLESKEKYALWFQLKDEDKTDGADWLEAREGHFHILRRQVVLLMVVQIIGSVAFLAIGAWLFAQNELSLGQFIAAEIIGGSIFLTLSKLAKFMETHYSLVTSFIKIDHATGDSL